MSYLNRFRSLASTLLLTAALMTSGVVQAQQSPLNAAPVNEAPGEKAPAKSLEPTEIYRQTVHSVVLLETDGGLGTGVVIDKARRLIVTNAHVIGKASEVKISFPEFNGADPILEIDHYIKITPTRGKVLETNRLRDLALVEAASIPDQITEIALAKASPSPASTVHVVGGLPRGSGALWSYANGSVRSVVRRSLDFPFSAKVIENDVPVNPGNSGGPAVNNFGELVGIVKSRSASAEVQLVSHFIDVSEVQAMVRELDPQSGLDFHRRALNRSDQGRHEEAVADYSQALRQGVDPVNARFSRGLSLRRLNRFEEAIADFTEMLRLAPSDADGYNQRGLAHYFSDHYAEAEKDFSEAIRLDPKRAVLWENRALSRHHASKNEAALEDINEAIRLDKEASFFDTKGQCLIALKNYDEALTALDQAIELDDDAAISFFWRAVAKRELSNADGAIQDFQQALKLDPQFIVAYRRLGELHVFRQDFDKAIEVYNMAIDLAPNDADLYRDRATALGQNGSRKQALADLDKAIELDPRGEFFQLRALERQAAGDEKGAAEDFEQAGQRGASGLTREFKRQLKLINKSGREVRVHLFYSSDVSGEWKWHGELTFTMKPDQGGVIEDRKFPGGIKAHKIRIWIEGEDYLSDEFRDKDMLLTPKSGYITSRGVTDYELAIN